MLALPTDDDHRRTPVTSGGSLSSAKIRFRAPSLNQSHYSSVATNFKADPVTGNPVAFEVGIFPVDSREARALGARDLEAETSRNFSIGLAATPVQRFTLTADFYYIAVDDRIVLTGFLDTPEVAAILASAGSPQTTPSPFRHPSPQ